jgi:hypothetical protein
LRAGLFGAADWLVENDIAAGWRRDFNRYVKRFDMMRKVS